MTGPGLGWLVGGHCLFSASVGWPGCLGPSSIMIAGNAQSRGRGPPAFAGRIASRTRPRGDRGEGAIGPDGRGQQVHSDWRPERGSTRRRTPDRSRDARASRSHQRRSALVVRARPNPSGRASYLAIRAPRSGRDRHQPAPSICPVAAPVATRGPRVQPPRPRAATPDARLVWTASPAWHP